MHFLFEIGIHKREFLISRGTDERILRAIYLRGNIQLLRRAERANVDAFGYQQKPSFRVYNASHLGYTDRDDLLRRNSIQNNTAIGKRAFTRNTDSGNGCFI